MILLSTAQVLRSHDLERYELYDDFILEMISEILKGGYLRDDNILLEFAPFDDKPINGPKGRLLNPGHAIEASWFILIEAIHRNDDIMLGKALKILRKSLEMGWDEKYEGLLYFVDIEGKPTEQLEWDMKLWWPHTEALYASALAWKITQDDFIKHGLKKHINIHFLNFMIMNMVNGLDICIVMAVYQIHLKEISLKDRSICHVL